MGDLSQEELARLTQDDQATTIKVIVTVFTVLSSIFVGLRFFARIKFTRYVGLEDYFIAASLCFSIIMGACIYTEANWGMGKRAEVLNIDQITNVLKYLWWSILAYCISLTLTKLSILIQYRRIFSVKEMRLPIYIVMGICTAFGVCSIITGIFTCVPVDAFWILTKQPSAKCINHNALWFANAGVNIATDLMVAALPVKSIWSLQIPKRQKAVLLFVLTIGWFVCIVSVLRLHVLMIGEKHPDDQTWFAAPGTYWSAIEINLAIVCACTPPLKPLIVKLIPAFSSRNGVSGHGTGSRANTSRIRRSFLEIDSKRSEGHAGDVVIEMDSPRVTAVPRGFGHEKPGEIYITRRIEQHSVDAETNSEAESQKDLVAESPTASKVFFRR